jgi:hypothetical protein
MEKVTKRSLTMKWKNLGFATMAMITALCIASLACGGSGDYLVPVTIKKVDKSEIKGYIVLHADEILRLSSWTSPGPRRESGRMVLWGSRKGEGDFSKLSAFERITFTEGGCEVFVSYGEGSHPIGANNFFSPKGIHFTTDASNPDVLPDFLHPGKIRWIKRTGRPREIR